jgi:hypothetical protein
MRDPRRLLVAACLLLLLLVAGLHLAALAGPPPPATGTPAANAQPPGGARDGLPPSIKQSYSEAEAAGTEAPPAPAPQPRKHSLWVDGVHVVGLGGGGLMALNLLLGATLLIGASAVKRMPRPVRKSRRKWHYAVGLIALALATLHAVLRYAQGGAFDLRNPPALALGGAAVLLACSGMIRAWPPPSLRRFPQNWMWTHRALILLAVLLLAAHVTGQILVHLQYMAKG